MNRLAVIALAIIGWTDAQGQTAAPAKPEFDVASVKPSNSGERPHSNFPLGPGNVYVPNGGAFSATGFPLITYISFAYKLMGNQTQFLLPQLPGWVTSEPFSIEARAESNPSKDEMRLMMRALLADRFGLRMHNETRQVPVLALVLAKPGKTGPHLVPHADGADCPTNLPPGYNDETVAGGFPVLCGGLLGQPPSAPGRTRVGARNVTMGFIANVLSGGAGEGRPMLDQTGLGGTFDFTLEWTPEMRGPAAQGADVQAEPDGPAFAQALEEQLGLKLKGAKGPVEVLVLDHVERPGAN